MKRELRVAAVSMAWVASSAIAQEPYAPARAPAGVELEVPSSAAVPVPPYPGASAVLTRGASSMKSGGQDVQCLHYIKLATSDGPEQVEAFYKDQLEGYTLKSHFGGMVRLFWRGESEPNPVDMTSMCRAPSVSITEATGAQMPGAKTAIEISDEPTG